MGHQGVPTICPSRMPSPNRVIVRTPRTRKVGGSVTCGGNVDQHNARGSAMLLANQRLMESLPTICLPLPASSSRLPPRVSLNPQEFQDFHACRVPDLGSQFSHLLRAQTCAVPHPRFPSVKSDSCVVEQLLSQCVVGHPSAACGFGSETYT